VVGLLQEVRREGREVHQTLQTTPSGLQQWSLREPGSESVISSSTLSALLRPQKDFLELVGIPGLFISLGLGCSIVGETSILSRFLFHDLEVIRWLGEFFLIEIRRL
jgi:hypothetical protein